jgi:hypothetical protein
MPPHLSCERVDVSPREVPTLANRDALAVDLKNDSSGAAFWHTRHG